MKLQEYQDIPVTTDNFTVPSIFSQIAFFPDDGDEQFLTSTPWPFITFSLHPSVEPEITLERAVFTA